MDDLKGYERTPQGQAMLLRYAVEGDKMLADPEIQSLLADLRRRDPGAIPVSDSNLLAVVMMVLASSEHPGGPGGSS